MILELQEDCLYELVDFDGLHNTRPWTMEQFAHAFEDRSTVVCGAYKKGRLAGFCIFKKIADQVDLQQVLIASNLRRQGIGKKLLEYVVSTSQEYKVKKILLEVREQNEAANQLYISFNFTVDGVRQNYYTNPLDNAILMSRSL